MGVFRKGDDEVATSGERWTRTEAMMLAVKLFIIAVMSWSSFSVSWDMVSVAVWWWKRV